MCLKETLTLKIFVKPFPCTLFSHYSQNISFTLTVAINITFRFTLVIPTGTRHPNPYLLLYVDIQTLTMRSPNNSALYDIYESIIRLQLYKDAMCNNFNPNKLFTAADV